MSNRIRIEDIEGMRREAGIDDVDLRNAIGRLRPGDFVHLTFRAGTNSPETLLVRVTTINSSAFEGELAQSPTTASLQAFRVGSPMSFRTSHIHSLATGPATIPRELKLTSDYHEKGTDDHHDQNNARTGKGSAISAPDANGTVRP